MSTQIVNPVRSDVTATPVDVAPAPRRGSRAWAVAGLVTGLASLGSVPLSMQVGPIYDRTDGADPAAVVAALGDAVPQLVALHVLLAVSTLTLTAFGFGLFRRLRDALPAGSLIPGVALFGAVATALMMFVGAGLDTEFVFAVTKPELLVPESAVFYDHWINTIPALWNLLGLTALAVHAASRRGAVARWLGRVSLGLGALTVLVGLVPLQYMSGLTGALWLVVAGVGLTFGDRRSRSARRA